MPVVNRRTILKLGAVYAGAWACGQVASDGRPGPARSRTISDVRDLRGALERGPDTIWFFGDDLYVFDRDLVRIPRGGGPFERLRKGPGSRAPHGGSVFSSSGSSSSFRIERFDLRSRELSEVLGSTAVSYRVIRGAKAVGLENTKYGIAFIDESNSVVVLASAPGGYVSSTTLGLTWIPDGGGELVLTRWDGTTTVLRAVDLEDNDWRVTSVGDQLYRVSNRGFEQLTAPGLPIAVPFPQPFTSFQAWHSFGNQLVWAQADVVTTPEPNQWRHSSSIWIVNPIKGTPPERLVAGRAKILEVTADERGIAWIEETGPSHLPVSFVAMADFV